MIKKIKDLFQSKFLQHVLTLASGTAAAQALGFLFIPILSRTYSQEAFGIFASYTAMMTLLSSFVTLKYDTALVLPKEDRGAYALLKISNLVAVFLTILSCVVLFLPIPYFQEYKGLQVFIAFGTILSVNYNNSALWNVRFKQFKITSLAKIIQVVAVFGFQILLFKYFYLKGLIYGSILGISCSGLYLILFRKLEWSIYKSISLSEMKAEAIRYIDFPKYFTLSNVILSLSANLPVLFFVKYISLAQLGIYGMAVRVIAQPVSLVSESFRSVILSYMAERRNKEEKVLGWYLKMLFFLFIASLIASVILYFLGPYIVDIFLGSKWQQVGGYMQMLIPMLISMMIASPGVAAVRVFEMQKYNLKYSVYSLVIKACSLMTLFYIGLAFEYLILFYSIVSLLVVCGNNLIIILKIKKYDESIAY